jgi:hypothetical protein
MIYHFINQLNMGEHNYCFNIVEIIRLFIDYIFMVCHRLPLI